MEIKNNTVVTSQPQEGYLMVRQFQYLGWAGHREVPASKRSFLKLILQVDQWQREGEEGEGRTIVHCLWVHVPAGSVTYGRELGHNIKNNSGRRSFLRFKWKLKFCEEKKKREFREENRVIKKMTFWETLWPVAALMSLNIVVLN